MSGFQLRARHFYETLASFGADVALIDEAGRTTSYEALDRAARAFALEIGTERRLVFLEAKNTPASIAAYLGCLIGGHPVYLFQKTDAMLLDRLTELYRPHCVVTVDAGAMTIERRHDDPMPFHPDLRLLLSTSGSTGSPKFVKLSGRNLDANAMSIADYLDIGLSDRAITSLKFNYSYGLSVINSHLAVGASLLLTERSVTEDAFWSLFRDLGATSFAGVPHSYESLARLEHHLHACPNLRYATQAGGRLSSELVRRFAALGREQGWRFYVMYGQTEAAPRMAYLPADLAETYPQAIGKAIPGGRIEILDEAGQAIAEPGRRGELVYRGPNVMMGYADGRDALATDDTPERLFTGDIAVWNAAHLVEIVGRSGRFVKPFGIRVNLDEVETHIRGEVPAAACTGDDSLIVVGLVGVEQGRAARLIADLARSYGLPAFVFRAVTLTEIPRLANGKTDYRAIMDRAGRDKGAAPGRRAAPARSELLLARNQMVTLLISGLWHGPAWTFVSWGAFHGAMLVAQRQLARFVRPLLDRSKSIRAVSVVFQVLLVFVLVAISRIFFRAESMSDAMLVMGKVVSGPYDWAAIDGKSTLLVCGAIIAGFLLCEAFVEYGYWQRHIARRKVLRTGIALCVLAVTLLLGDFTGGKFIYVQF